MPSIVEKLQDQVKTIQSNMQATRASLIAGRSGDQRILDKLKMGRSGGGILGLGILKGMGGTSTGSSGASDQRASQAPQDEATRGRKTPISLIG